MRSRFQPNALARYCAAVTRGAGRPGGRNGSRIGRDPRDWG